MWLRRDDGGSSHCSPRKLQQLQQQVQNLAPSVLYMSPQSVQPTILFPPSITIPLPVTVATKTSEKGFTVVGREREAPTEEPQTRSVFWRVELAHIALKDNPSSLHLQGLLAGDCVVHYTDGYFCCIEVAASVVPPAWSNRVPLEVEIDDLHSIDRSIILLLSYTI